MLLYRLHFVFLLLCDLIICILEASQEAACLCRLSELWSLPGRISLSHLCI